MVVPFPIRLPALAALGLIAACAPAAPDARPTAAAADVVVAEDGARPTFVSLNPCLDAILVEVADRDQILAISHYSHRPGGSRMDRDKALSFASNGGTAEEIIALKPDIVLASVFTPPATKAALERAGVRIEVFDSPKTLEQSAAQTERIATLVGYPHHAKGMGTALHAPPVYTLPPAYIEANAGPDPSVLLWQAGQIVAGQETLIAQLLKEAGFTSHAEALGLEQADYVSLERVVSDPPDLLLVAGDSTGQQHPALDRIEGMRVHHFDPSLFYCGGPSVADARDALFRLRLSFYERAQ
ncbi:MAG: ABC transporter substrate-binding protein [Pseudomonadota bacterium]